MRPSVKPKEAAKTENRGLSQMILGLTIAAAYVVYLAQPIDLTMLDLGRHLKNGEMILQNWSVPDTNLYSYTHPDYPFVNHHWGSGVVFYLVKSLVGFPGLSVFFILIQLITFYLFFDLARRHAAFEIAAPVALIVFPLLITRNRIRPEIFSYFLSALFLRILWNYNRGNLRARWLFLLPLLELLWVNLHIYFFLGPVLTAVFFVENLSIWGLVKKDEKRRTVRQLGMALLGTLVATLFNPFGLSGALYPIYITQGYGYPVLENNPAWIVSRSVFLPRIYFEITFLFLVLSWLYLLVRSRNNFSLSRFLLALFFSASAWLAIRNFALFAYFALPIAAVNFKELATHKGLSSLLKPKLALPAILFLTSLGLVLVKPDYFLSLERGRRGIGVKQGVGAAAEFFLKEDLQGPIFNNYDIGSYLVFYLYPKHRVFVDNRPEAYPESFFADLYIPLQSDEAKWANISRAYNFNAIFFHHRDFTPWGNRFIVRRVLDPAWAPVYFDEDVIILLKRYGPNQSAIAKYELPRDKVLEPSN